MQQFADSSLRFRVTVKRANKRFPTRSMDMQLKVAEEILNVFSLLSTDEIDVLEMNKQASAKENTTYTMKNAKATVNGLKMIANAIEKGIEK